jgi:hypothetical protein
MRLVHVIVIVVLGSACGSVKANNADAGVDGVTCGGTVDGNGNCVCPARFVAPDCATCAPGWSGDSCSEFSDTFNRGAGALGSDYADLVIPLAEDALIVNNRACGDVQSVGILAEVIDSPQLSAQLSFDPGNVDGQELSFLLASDADLTTLGEIFLAGCEGGGGTCNLRISPASGAPLAERQLVDVVPSGALTQVTLEVDAARNVTVGLTINGASEQITAVLPVGFTIQRFGFVVGREPDGTLSCVDDLLVQVN